MKNALIISLVINLLGAAYVGWLKLGHSMGLRTSLTYMSQLTYQIGYQVGKTGQYPNFLDSGPTRIELISEDERKYVLIVPTTDGYVLSLYKDKGNPAIAICHISDK